MDDAAFGAYPIIQFAVGSAIAVLTVVATIMGLRKKEPEKSEEAQQLSLFAHLTPTLDFKLNTIMERQQNYYNTVVEIRSQLQRLEDRLERIEGRCLFVPEIHGRRR